jgi:malonate-semialdehyde dehydrogenase (acetylating)/methylmalonate-semialdehyde dehydrogenase
MVYNLSHYIDGKQYNETSNPSFSVYNPALGEIIASGPVASITTCNFAVESAKAAFPSWSQTTAAKRANILFNFRGLLEKYRMDLAKIVTREHGKTIEDAKGSIARAIELVEFYCGLVGQLQGTYSANVSNHIDCYTIRQPLGVCAGASPFNFPIMVPVWMMIPAIACGNTFILKPSEQTPSASLRLLELLSEAGLPPGVANALLGDRTTVEHLLQHPDVAAFTAVASTPVAESIYITATANGKRAHTFGGAKNHCLVMPDADLDLAATAIVGAAYGSAGERCMAISVVVAVGASADPLLEKLIPKIQAIRIDAGDSLHCDMGPLVSAIHRERVLAAIDKGVAEGAKLIIDGRSFIHPENPQGFYMGPSLFDEVRENMSIYQQEIFGPVLVLLRVNNFESAIALVNTHQYGNGAAIFTRDGYTAQVFSQRVQVGMVGVNVPIPVPVVSHPFGGWKRSSFGDTDMHGKESIHFYTRPKSVTSQWLAKSTDDNAFAMPVHK